MIALAPGDPCATDDPRVTVAVLKACRVRLGLDGPLLPRYTAFLAHAARGDLGISFLTQRPVAEMIGDALPNTLLLMGVAIALSVVAGLAVGILQSVWPRAIGSRIAAAISLALYSLPDFWLAQVALLVFAYTIPIFPAGGTVAPVVHDYLGFGGRIADRLYHLLLPALTLAALNTAWIARYQRGALLEVAHEDYMRTARAKGLRERDVILRHALRNALLPLITNIGLSLPALLGGALFVEQVFAWPGMGRLAFYAIYTRDAPVVLGCAVIASVAVVTGSFLADLLYAVADPRLRA